MYRQKKIITIEGTAERFFAGLIENDVLSEYQRFSLTDPVILGRIIKGQVQKESGTLHSYYVNLQLDHPGFWNAGGAVKGGTQPIVQVIQEPRGKKGYRVTEHYTIPGRYLVLTPFDPRIHVSLRVDDPAEQKRLRETARSLPGDGHVGWILRTEALSVDSESILAEGAYLYDLHREIENRGITAPVGAILYEPVHPLIS
ncbi:MAG: ribonuclease E/G, partial [Firmicutes bacterium]|nr:ribonuclease E/G [Bacillota bacterium]